MDLWAQLILTEFAPLQNFVNISPKMCFILVKFLKKLITKTYDKTLQVQMYFVVFIMYVQTLRFLNLNKNK